MARLRAPNGCPWDREQTHTSLRTYLIEEAYEVLDALEANDDVKFAEELGDLLLQVLFHSQIAREEGRFSITDVIREIHEKMVRRHPHVFGEKRAKNAAEVLHNWEIIKREERRAKSGAAEPAHQKPESLLDGVPRSLPALLEGYQLTSKAARIGFDWDNIEGIFDKLTEETRELRQVLATDRPPTGNPERSEGSLFNASSKQPSPAESTNRHPEQSEGSLFDPAGTQASPAETTVEAEVGDLLFACVNLARFLKLDPEIALKKANSKFARRFRTMERLAREQGTTLAEVPRAQMESLWDQAKRLEESTAKAGVHG